MLDSPISIAHSKGMAHSQHSLETKNTSILPDQPVAYCPSAPKNHHPRLSWSWPHGAEPNRSLTESLYARQGTKASQHSRRWIAALMFHCSSACWLLGVVSALPPLVCVAVAVAIGPCPSPPLDPIAMAGLPSVCVSVVVTTEFMPMYVCMRERSIKVLSRNAAISPSQSLFKIEH